jgi:hypothetical protein
MPVRCQLMVCELMGRAWRCATNVRLHCAPVDRGMSRGRIEMRMRREVGSATAVRNPMRSKVRSQMGGVRRKMWRGTAGKMWRSAAGKMWRRGAGCEAWCAAP